MRNIMKKLFVCLLVTLFAFTIVSCKGDEDTYQYPDKTPTVANPDGIFMQYGDLKVTNNQAYVKLLNTYGYDEIINWLDEQINDSKLPNDNNQDFVDYLNEQKYGTTDPQGELTAEEIKNYDEKWIESMKSKGYDTEADWMKYYKISYIRKANAKEVLVAEIETFNKLYDALNAIDFAKNVTTDLTLKTAIDSLPDSKITWTSNSSYVVVEDGVAKVSQGKYDNEVVLTATATYNDLSTKATYTFTVPAKGSSVSGDEKAEKEVNGYITNAEYDAYLDTNYKGDVKVALVFFDSYNEAVEALKEAGVTLTDYTTQSWNLTEAQVKEVFVKLNAATTGVSKSFDDLTTSYTYKDLAALNSVIATGVYALNGLNEVGTVVDEETVVLEDCYTVVPQVYGSKFYLALNVEEEATPELETVKEEIYGKLLETKVTLKYIAYVQYKNILAGSLAIYDEGLENKFVAQYQSAFTSASEEAPEYTRTEGVHDSIVLSYEGKELTAQVLFERLLAKYGAKLAEGYLDSYFVLSNSTIYNFYTDEVKDQEKYDDAKEELIDTLRGNFENNNYEASGYPASYGWSNYLRDAHGILNEKELLIDSTGAIYQNAYEQFSGYLDELTEAEYTAALELALEAEKDYFNVTAYGISAYVDNNNDGNADEFIPDFIEEDHEEDFLNLTTTQFLTKYATEYADKVEEIENAKALLEQNAKLTGDFVSLVWDIILASYNKEYTGIFNKEQKARLAEIITIISAKETSYDRVVELKKVYATSTLKDPIFGNAKRAQLQMDVISSTTYSSTSNISDTYKEVLVPVYKAFEQYIAANREAGKVNNDDHVIFGSNLDPYHTYTVDGDNKGYYVVDGPFTSEAFLNINRTTMFVVTKATEKTYLSREVFEHDGVKSLIYAAISSSISHENYKNYLKDLDDDSNTTSGLSSDVKTLIKTYLVSAINELKADATTKLTKAELAALNDVTLDAAIKAKVQESLNKSLEE